MLDNKGSDPITAPEHVREALADCSVAMAYERAGFALTRDEVPDTIGWESLAPILSQSRQLDGGLRRRLPTAVQSAAPLEQNTAGAYITLPGIFSMLAGIEASETTVSELRQLLNDNPQIDTWEALAEHLSAPPNADGDR